MVLQIDGVAVQTWANVGGNAATGVLNTFNYTHPTDVTADRVRVAFTNDSGGSTDLRVDRIQVANVQYETEAADTFSTGATIGGVPSPGYRTTETLQANGYFQYRAIAPTDRTIEVLVAGSTNSETIQLRIGATTVANYTVTKGSYTGGVYQSFRYTHTAAVNPAQVQVAFTNDGRTSTNADRNVRIDGILVNGVKYESESSETYTTGTGEALTGITPGYKRSEYLTNNGYFQYYGAQPVGGTTIEILAAGATNQETVQLQINGAAVRTWTGVKGNYNGAVYETFRFTTASVVAPNTIRVAYTNDGNTSTGVDKNLRVDAIRVNGVRYESEAINTFATGGPLASPSGFRRSEFLYNNGYFAYAQPLNPGTLAIASAQYTVVEGTPTVGVTFTRSGGSDGTVTIDYTTVNASAIAGQDYTAQNGTVTFLQGETSKTVNIAIANDALGEGTESFNVAADRVTGGAGLGAPRTATIRIIDDEAPSPGGGNGLRGEYYSDLGLTTLAAQRTDAKVDFNWGGGAPTPQVGADNFSVRWTGQIEALYSGVYTFYLTSDDGSRMWVNGTQLIDGWVDQSATTRTGFFTFVAGQKYDIRVESYERTGNASVVLEWSSLRQVRQVVPQSQLFSTPIVPTSGSFAPEVILGGLVEPTAIDFGPNGMMFIAQKNGVVKTYVGGQAQNFIDISADVNNVRDRGLLGMAVHPDFVNNPYVYLLYTYDPPETVGQTGLAAPDQYGNRVARLVRVTADVSTGYRTAVAGSQEILVGKNSTWANISFPNLDGTDNVNLPATGVGIEDIIGIDSQSHSVGALRFGTDGSLFITNGDGTSYGRVDPRSALVQDLTDFRGKVLRINPLTGEGYANNPFYNGNLNADQSKVFNYGLRNPFRLAIHPTLGLPYVGDVGWNTHEEINIGAGQNFGWPWYEGTSAGNAQTGGYRDLPQAATFYASNNANPPIWSRAHSAGGVAIVVGDFYTGQQYPAAYQNTLFFTDFGDPTIRALQLNSQGFVTQELVVSGSVGTVVMMDMGPDGYMYYVDINGSVGRFNFSATGSVPLATPISASTPVAEVATSVVIAPQQRPIASPARRAAFASLATQPLVAVKDALLLARTVANYMVEAEPIATTATTKVNRSTRAAAFAFVWEELGAAK